MLLPAWMAPASAFAQEASPEVAQAPADSDLDEAAQALYRAGAIAFERGRYEQALGYFADGYEMSGRHIFLYNIGLTQDRMMRLRDAIDSYQRYLERVPGAAGREGVERRIAIMQRHLSEGSGERAEEEADDADEHEQQDDGGAPQDENASRRPIVGPILSFTVAAGGIATFIAGALISKQRYEDLEDECAPDCDPGRADEVRRPALLADIGPGIAGAAVVTGVVWLLVGSHDSDDDSPVDVRASTDGAHVTFRRDF